MVTKMVTLFICFVWFYNIVKHCNRTDLVLKLLLGNAFEIYRLTSELRVRLAPFNWFKPSSETFYWPFQGGTSFVDLLWFFCLVFAMPFWASVYMCLVVTCWERADLLALVCGVQLWIYHFSLVSWVGWGTWLYRFLIFAPLLIFIT